MLIPTTSCQWSFCRVALTRFVPHLSLHHSHSTSPVRGGRFFSRLGFRQLYSTTAWVMERSFSTSINTILETQELPEEKLEGISSLRSLCKRRKARKNARRFSADNTRGRSEEVRDIIKMLKTFDNKLERDSFFSQLHPREKVDVLKMLHRKSKSRKKHASGLPKYFSQSFARSFFFREEDLQETTTLGRGPGGQATNRRKQTVVLVHTPTQIVVKVSRFPSLRLNKRAAREILNLRLEEQLAGDKSFLGRAKLAAARRAARNALEREERVWRKAVRAWRSSHSTNYFGFLTGDDSLPPYVLSMAEVAHTSQGGKNLSNLSNTMDRRTKTSLCSRHSRSLKIADILNMENRDLWSMVFRSCGNANAGIQLLEKSSRVLVPARQVLQGENNRTLNLHTSNNDNSVTKSSQDVERKEAMISSSTSQMRNYLICNSKLTSVEASAASKTQINLCCRNTYHTPPLLHFFFPVAHGNTPSFIRSGEGNKEGDKQQNNIKNLHAVELCRNSPVVLRRVKALLTVFLELFGLRFDEECTSFRSASNPTTYHDGAHKGAQKQCTTGKRLFLVKDGRNGDEFHARLFTETGELTHVSCIIFFHLLQSTRDLGFQEERDAMKKFFRRHTRRMLKSSSATQTINHSSGGKR